MAIPYDVVHRSEWMELKHSSDALVDTEFDGRGSKFVGQ